MQTKIPVLLLLLLAFSSFHVRAQDSRRLVIDARGAALKQFYLQLDVENFWISGRHVNWETGEPDKPGAEEGIKTHCSAFVAAACQRLGIYILRPPEHGQLLLSNAQFDWLASGAGQAGGWIPVSGPNAYLGAQELANNGFVVVAACKNPDVHVPGHVALVVPAHIYERKLQEERPMLTMAGTHNFNYISLRSGFRSHINSWPEQAILFYYHPIPQPGR